MATGAWGAGKAFGCLARSGDGRAVRFWSWHPGAASPRVPFAVPVCAPTAAGAMALPSQQLLLKKTRNLCEERDEYDPPGRTATL
jgi:hypothetical protein